MLFLLLSLLSTLSFIFISPLFLQLSHHHFTVSFFLFFPFLILPSSFILPYFLYSPLLLLTVPIVSIPWSFFISFLSLLSCTCFLSPPHLTSFTSVSFFPASVHRFLSPLFLTSFLVSPYSYTSCISSLFYLFQPLPLYCLVSLSPTTYSHPLLLLFCFLSLPLLPSLTLLQSPLTFLAPFSYSISLQFCHVSFPSSFFLFFLLSSSSTPLYCPLFTFTSCCHVFSFFSSF